MSAPEQVQVTQRVREIYLAFNKLPPPDAERVLAGDWDKAHGMQLIARFEAEARHTAQSDLLAAMREAAEALERAQSALPVLKNMLKTARLGKGADVANEMIATNATALAKLTAAIDQMGGG